MMNDDKRHINLEIKKQNNRIEAHVSVAGYSDHTCRRKIRVETADVLEMIRERGIKVGKCIISSSIQNKRRTAATWVFEGLGRKKAAPQTKIEEKPEETETNTTSRSSRRKKRKTQQNSEKTQKNLDNSEKDVIIEEETNTEE